MRLAERWQSFWFRPADVTDLGVARLLFFGLLALFYLPYDFSGWGDVSRAYWQPLWLFERFRLPLFSAETLRTMQVVWKLALACAAIGLLTRTSIAIVAVLGTYLLGLGHNFGQTYHFDALLVLAFWILAFSRAGDAWSVDAWRRRSSHGVPLPFAHAEYRWPIQLILVAQALVFFAAGVAKLWTSGSEWFTSDHLSLLLQRVQYNISDADPLLPWGSYISTHPWMYQAMAFGTVVIETAYPIALFSRRLRVPMVLAGMGLVIGIRALMGPTFEHFLFINLFWVPWHRVLHSAPVRSTEAVALGPLVGEGR
jgi:hypothetical protein